ncbi:20433_t:CDS:2 [Entrophospora sp. SA101]|nr:7256_t:CDS:2 [Entrophospora sp. SA101]CAJ0761383.1 20433_t:CDS:2 [Entrophospora sp. SA101]CAJ0882487.1 10662_t:CDS:2 [Entrophospora sp. SA101]
MNEQQLENINEALMNQPNIKQIIRDYKFVFPCPHCEKVINDDHFNKEHKAFNYIKLETNRTYENLPAVKELKENLEKQTKRIAELQSSEYVESLERVKKLVIENQELRQQNQNFLLAQNRPIKRKGELFEQYVAEELSRVFDDKDKISKLTQLGKKADFLQEVLTETEPRQVAGRIVYETKDTEK